MIRTIADRGNEIWFLDPETGRKVDRPGVISDTYQDDNGTDLFHTVITGGRYVQIAQRLVRRIEDRQLPAPELREQEVQPEVLVTAECYVCHLSYSASTARQAMRDAGRCLNSHETAREDVFYGTRRPSRNFMLADPAARG